jgi:hypothetical protein
MFTAFAKACKKWTRLVRTVACMLELADQVTPPGGGLSAALAAAAGASRLVDDIVADIAEKAPAPFTGQDGRYTARQGQRSR